jgi:two-component system, sensor histidine kinase YesM
MARRRVFPGRLSLRKRDFLVLALSLSLMNILFFALYYTESMRRLATNTRESLGGKLALMDRTIRATLDQYALPGRYLATGRDFQQILTLTDTRSLSGNRMAPLIDEVSSLSRLIQGYPGGTESQRIELYLYSTSSLVIKGIAPNVRDLSAIDHSPFYSRIEKGQEYSLIRVPYTDGGGLDAGYLYLARQVYSLYEPDIRFAGVLMTRIPMEDIRAILASGIPTPGSTISIVEDTGWVQASSRPSLEGTNQRARFPKVRVDAGDTVFFQGVFDGRESWISAIGSVRHWYVVAVTPIREAVAPLRNLAIVLFAMLAGSLVVSAFLSYGLSRQIADPIEKLVGSIRMAQKGDFSLGIDHPPNDEFSLLVAEYNRMLTRIDTLVKEKTDAELTALQAQINPHFLYNALDTVNWMALDAGARGISEIVTRLSDFYRYSLSKGRKVIPLGDEIEQVRSYLMIQALQYPDAFAFTLECGQEYRGYETVKLVVQPLVENAIVHGFQDIEWKGLIGITVAGDADVIRIEVSDNGRGADAGRLNAALAGGARSSEYFAIQNIDSRIRDRYGAGYGLAYRPGAEGRGITAVITIPRVRAEAR